MHARNFRVITVEKYGTSTWVLSTATLTDGGPTGPKVSGGPVVIEPAGLARAAVGGGAGEVCVVAEASSSVRSVRSPKRFCRVFSWPLLGGRLWSWRWSGRFGEQGVPWRRRSRVDVSRVTVRYLCDISLACLFLRRAALIFVLCVRCGPFSYEGSCFSFGDDCISEPAAWLQFGR